MIRSADAETLTNPRSPSTARRPPDVATAPGHTYRPDIDGLRAVAVLAVVVYHAFPSLLPGGYVGVDVFFVISGYLITGIIDRDVRARRFSIRRFYERRVRRILPALVLVLAVTTVVATAVLLPDDLARYGRTLASVGLMGSNVMLWRTYQGGYFDESAESDALLHTWSLSVEEQFYVLFPLLMLLLARWRPRQHTVMALVTVAGLALATVIARWDTAAAFYLAPARAWELAIGATAALWPTAERSAPTGPVRVRKEAVAALGLAAVLASTLLLPAAPTPWQLAPACLGTAMVIRVGTTTTTWTSRGLAWRPVVAVGLVSYSLYLWHWPLLVLGREWSIDALSATATVALLLLAGALAWLSWRYVEAPFRRPRQRASHRAPTTRRTLVLGALSLLAVGAVGATTATVPVRDASPTIAVDASPDPGAVADEPPDVGDPSPSPPTGPPATSMPTPSATEVPLVLDDTVTDLPSLDCIDQPVDAGCVVGAPVEPTIALVGDSHAHALVEALGEAARRRQAAMRSFTKAGCVFGPEVARSGNQPESVWCLEHNAAVLDHLLATPRLSTVVVAGHWAAALDGSLDPLGPDESTTPRAAFDATGREVPDAEVPELVEAGLRDTLRRLVDDGRRVVVVGPTVDMGYDVPDTLARLERRGQSWRDFGIDRRAHDARNEAAAAMLDRVTTSLDIPLVRPVEAFCDARRCHAVRDGVPLYADDDHVNVHGARIVVRLVESALDGA